MGVPTGSLDRYSRYCGPAVLAAVTGSPRTEAAEVLARRRRDRRKRVQNSTDIVDLRHVLREYGFAAYVTAPARRVTVSRWLGFTRSQSGTYILRASHHFIAVRNGEIIEDNGHTPFRGLVTHVLHVGGKVHKEERPMTQTTTLERPAKDQSFSVRDVPWMKVGTQIDKPVTAEKAAQLGGMDFAVDLVTAGYLDPRDGIWKTAPKRKAVLHHDTGEVFEFVSDGYTPLQYGEAFSFMGKAKFVAAGTLRGGRQGYLVVDPDISIEPGGDPHKLYIVLRTSHDRSRGVEISLMPLANRCMNQLGLKNFAGGAPQRWSIHHTSNMAEKMHQAKVVLERAGEYATGYSEQVEQLQLITPTEAQARDILGQVILHGGKKKDDEINKIIQLWHGDTEHVGFNDTAWGLVQAVSETLEWQRRTRADNPESRFLMGLDGYTYRTINRTTELVLAA